ncbi:MAG TPA: nucleoside-diphosphate kinase [Actinomycetota bacterium]|nr:nucleoside-diphosphate kinase [Actinomycetota bacterium]
MTDKQQTFIMVKPDGVRRRLVGEVIKRIEEAGYEIEQMKMFTIDRPLAERHYAEHKDKPFFGELTEFITSDRVVAMVVAGDDVVAGMRELMGATDPADAAPGTIRADLAESLSNNVVHGSDSPESATREIGLFFG